MAKSPSRTRAKPSAGARFAAWTILTGAESGRAALELVRERTFASGSLDERDRALVTEITQGVARHRTFLDAHIDPALERPGQQLPGPVRTALRIGAYQMVFLRKIPVHAAVGETVEALKNTRYRRFAPLVNAVLRRMSSSPPPSLPDPAVDPVANLQVAASAPPWLVDRLVASRGLVGAREVLLSINRPGPLALRASALFGGRERLLSDLDDAGVRARPGRLSPTAVILDDGGSPMRLGPFVGGRCTVQDEGAQMIAPLLGAQPGDTVVDACAAPGGKAGHLAELMGGLGSVLALDSSLPRAVMMARGIARMGLSCVHPVVADVLTLPFLLARPPRLVLLDAPCSGTGVLRRHPEGKWKKDAEGVRRLAQGQLAMLQAAGRALAPGGRILYTTCSLLAEENEDVVDAFLKSAPFTLADLRATSHGLPSDTLTPRGELRLWPHIHDTDGFYAALLIKY